MTLPLWFTPPSRDSGSSRSRPLTVVRGDAEVASAVSPPHPDAVLIAGINAGDETAFADLFRTYYPRLTAYAGSLLGDPDEGRDLVCDFFAHLFIAHEQFTPTGPVRAYLFRSVRNRVANARRSKKVIGRHARIVQVEAGAHSSAGQAASTRPGDDPRVLALIDDIFASLPERAREAASLRWRQGFSLEEIAETLGIAKPSVAMLLSRTLKTLRHRLAPLRQRLMNE